ncbi:MAG: hypothetical protein WCZ66_06325 [Sphingomonadaceae bacterium]
MPNLNPAMFATPAASIWTGTGERLLRATRLWTMFAQSRRNPRQAVGLLLGPATTSFLLLMEMTVTAWPEPFITCPPCANITSPDEATLMALFDHAEADNPTAAHRLLADMLPHAIRERLWQTASSVIAETVGAPWR